MDTSEHQLQTRKERQVGIREQRAEDEFQDLTFEGDEDSGGSQWVIDRWVSENEAGQCQEGVDRPKTVQQHGRPTSSSTRRVFLNKNLCRNKPKRTCEKMVSQLNTAKKRRKRNLPQ